MYIWVKCLVIQIQNVAIAPVENSKYDKDGGDNPLLWKLFSTNIYLTSNILTYPVIQPISKFGHSQHQIFFPQMQSSYLKDF